VIKKKFWRGSKRLAKKYYPGRVWNYFETHGLPEAGDITHDCDGFNHVIKSIVWKWYPVRILKKTKNGFKYKTLNLSILLPDTVYQDYPDAPEHYVCSCGGLEFQIPKSVNEIKNYFASWSKASAAATDAEYNLGLFTIIDNLDNNVTIMSILGIPIHKPKDKINES
jgi:hypothetical protein